jgi:hypothetical protein
VATDLTHAEGDTVPATRAAALPRPHRVRFGLIYVALGAIVAAAIAGGVVFANRSINPSPAWSSWKPNGGGLGAAQRIADHVAKQYHLPNGNQLVDVMSKAPSLSPPSSGTLPLHYVAVKGTKGSGDQVYPMSGTNSVMYSLCGLGTGCAIATGKPTQERGRLVRREILELALYTFKYVPGVENVIAFIPPALGKQYVIYLRRSDLAPELKQPLTTTLRSSVPLPKAIPAREVRMIDATTVPRVYTFGVAQAPQGDLVFVLTPLPKLTP